MDMDDEEAVGGGGAQPESTLVFLKLDHDQKKRGVAPASGGGGGGRRSGGGAPSCQVERCAADLMEAKKYYRRHKVCEVHAKAPAVLVAGLRQRFCQQCSRFHELSEFDGAKRSCRRRLAGHNQRRRRSSSGKSRLMLSSSTSTTSAGCTHPGTHLLSAG